MASTEQRSGFRLPWASEPRPGSDIDAEATEMAEATPTPARGAPKWPAGDVKAAESSPDLEPEAAEASTEATEATEATNVGASPADPAPTAARARPVNPLVTGLVRAMRAASTAARQEAVDRFTSEAKARIEAIHAQSADEATELRKQSDAEIVEIRDWSKAEVTRVRETTDQRIADRRGRLEAQVEEHAARIERRIDRVQAAAAEFERRMDTFFERLLAEEDPARLAGLAESLPEPPSLDIDDLDADGAAAAEAEALANLGTADLDIADMDQAEMDVVGRLETFAGEHLDLEPPSSSTVAVVGLVSVASIAGFKRALAKTPGVRSVTVASGPTGDFIFSVAHEPKADLRAAVVALDGFGAVITSDVDGVLTVTASDPESTR